MTNKATTTPTDANLVVSDVTTNNVSTSAHGFVPKAPNDETKFLDGTGAFAAVEDDDLSVSDITTNNVSTSAHGFAPKAPNDATKYLDGTGAYSVPAGTAGAWTSYTPTWTNSGNAPTVGNAQLAGGYNKVGREVTVKASFIFGSTSAIGTGRMRMSLPFTSTESGGLINNFPGTVGRFVTYNQATGGTTFGSVYADTSTTVCFDLGGIGIYVGVGNPFAWLTNDFLFWEYTYESTT